LSLSDLIPSARGHQAQRRSPFDALMKLRTAAEIRAAIERTTSERDSLASMRVGKMAQVELERDRGRRSALKREVSGFGERIAECAEVLTRLRSALLLAEQNEAIAGRGGVPIPIWGEEESA
jgi:hypothetical protein